MHYFKTGLKLNKRSIVLQLVNLYPRGHGRMDDDVSSFSLFTSPTMLMESSWMVFSKNGALITTAAWIELGWMRPAEWKVSYSGGKLIGFSISGCDNLSILFPFPFSIFLNLSDLSGL